MIYVSLCIPTNGISEWVFPVLDAIYKQNTEQSLFEVIVTDNGDNEAFGNAMKDYVDKYNNLKYKKTKAFLFENQIEALRLAEGEYLKFLNHRSILEDGAIEWMISLVRENLEAKPVMYLSNGVLKLTGKLETNSFDEFVRGLKHYASWTTGVGVWKSDFEKISVDHVYNKISPHSDVLFAERKRGKYIIDDKIWCHDIDLSHKNKGKYDLYKAFAIEEPSITLGLFTDGDISASTLKSVIRSYAKFVAGCYRDFNILHKPCSYKIDGFNEAMGIFMNKKEVLLRAYGGLIKGIFRRR